MFASNSEFALVLMSIRRNVTDLERRMAHMKSEPARRDLQISECSSVISRISNDADALLRLVGPDHPPTSAGGDS